MSQKLVQVQKESLQQQALPMQLALAKLLELPVTDMSQRVEQEMMENAALEPGEGDRDEQEDLSTSEPVATDEEEENASPLDEALGDYLSSDDTPSYLLRQAEEAHEQKEIPSSAASSLFDNLNEQAGEQTLTPHQDEILRYLIGSLDNDGLLRKNLAVIADELSIYHDTDCTETEVAEMLAVLQTFEPHGVGARSLQECLLLQLQAIGESEGRSLVRRNAEEVVRHFWNDFTHKRWEAIRQALILTEEDVEAIRGELTRLNPAPGGSLSHEGETARGITPDFYVTVETDGTISVQLNNGDLPELHISRAFRNTIQSYGETQRALSRTEREALVYAREKVAAARSFIELIRRRNQTLLSVMETIVELQRPFFDEDDENLLRPLKLQDISDRTGLDKSTISRVTTSKYVETAYGIYPLRYFFSTQFVAESGEELSQRKVKAALCRIIEAEDKRAPLSDEALAAALKAEGFPVARRTVAKYREALGLPVARLRR